MKSKFIALFTAFFLLTSLPINKGTMAAPPEEVVVSLADFALPATLGKIESRFVAPNSSRWIVQIQDVHAHIGAQENVSAIVDHLNAVYGIKTVALEGGWDRTTFKKSWGLPNSREKQQLARVLLEDTFLCGPSYAALFTPQPINLIGIEDAALYEKNRQTYVKHLDQREAMMAKIAAWEQKLSSQKLSVYSPEALAFDKMLREFREGNKADKFLPSLIATADSKKVSYSGLGQIVLFKQSLDLEKQIAKDKLEAEAKRLMTEFKRARLSFEELLKSGTIPADKLEFYPAAKKYLELMKLQEKIAHREFFKQIEKLIGLVKGALLTSEPEKAADATFERFLNAKKILMFQATPDDLKNYEKEKLAIASDVEAAGLTPAFQLGQDFYDVAMRRDKSFFQKITSDAALKGNIAVFTGGFHTEGLSAQLEAAGISYLVLTPDLGTETPDEKLYFQKLRVAPPKVDTAPIPAQNLQTFRAELTPATDNRIAEAVARWMKKMASPPDLVLYVETGESVMVGFQQREQISKIDPTAFMKMLPEKQKGEVKRWLETIKKNKQPLTLVSKTSSWQEVLESTLGQMLWGNYIGPESSVSVVELQDVNELIEVMMGKRHKTIPLKGSDTFEGTLQTALKLKEKETVAVIDNQYPDALPVQESSLVLPFLGITKKADLMFMNRVQEILRDLMASGWLQKSA